MNGTQSQPPEGGDPLREVRRDLYESDSFAMEQDAMLERRITELEEVEAARWPRRILVRWRLARQLRASVATYGDWAGRSWADKRAEAVGEELITSQPQPERATRPPVATGVTAAGYAVVAAADLPVLLGALADAATCQGGHLSTPHVAAAYRALSRALGDDR